MKQTATQICQQLQDLNWIGVFAGGCVRDELLGRTPKDYDIATNATPDQVKQIFSNDNCILVGEKFGVIALIRDGVQYEVATLRGDSAYSDGRRPDSVTFVTDLKEDASR